MVDTREMTARFRVLLMCVAVASAACGAKGRFMDGNRADARARDTAAIQKLREQDGAATLAEDVAAIAELWTDAIVLIEPGQRCAMKEPHVYVRTEYIDVAEGRVSQTCNRTAVMQELPYFVPAFSHHLKPLMRDGSQFTSMLFHPRIDGGIPLDSAVESGVKVGPSLFIRSKPSQCYEPRLWVSLFAASVKVSLQHG